MNRLLLLIAAILTTVACSEFVDENVAPTPERDDAIESFDATLSEEMAARMGLNANYQAIWQADDALTVISYSAYDASAVPTLTECNIDNETIGQTTATARFDAVSPIFANDEMYAIYPFDATLDAASFTGGSTGNRTLNLRMPMQRRSENGLFRYPQLVGKWSSESRMFHFTNNFAILGIKLTSSTACHLHSITVSGNNGEKMWGDVTVSTADGSVEFANTALSYARIMCDGVELGLTAKSVYIAVPAQNYTKGLTVNIACEEGYMSKVLKSGGIDCSNYDNTVLELPTVPVSLSEYPITADVARATDGSVVVGWTITKANIGYLSDPYPNQSATWTNDVAKTYKASLYSSPECSDYDLIVSYDNISGLFASPQQPPRFIFTNLEPSTEYWVLIENVTDGTAMSIPLKIQTTAPLADASKVVKENGAVGDLILYENFNKLIYAGDLATRAAGVSRGDRGSLTSIIYPSGALSDYSSASADKKFYLVNGSTEIGLFNTLKQLLDDFGLEDWGWIGGGSSATGGSVCARPGYLKIGTSNNRTAIVTPELSGIPNGKTASVRVDFRACPYGGNSATVTASEKDIIVKALVGASLQSDWNVTYSSDGDGKALTLSGDYNTDWNDYSVTISGLTNASRIAISGNASSATTTNRFMLDDIRVTITNLASAEELTGRITAHANDGGGGVEGVVVSDGYSVVKTNADGYYSMTYNANAKFICYTTPADREIVFDSKGYPLYYQRVSGNGTYNFTLGRKIEKQTQWHLYVMADPQTHEANGTSDKLCLSRFKTNLAADLKSTVQTYGYNSAPNSGSYKRAYGMVLGDVSWNSGKSHMQAMYNAMAADQTYVHWFTVPGNHDWYASDDDTNPSLDNYHAVFGPSCYSFDRGDVHIIGMNNTITASGNEVATYDKGFTADEYKWLQKDLKEVSTDKCVILCVHIPFFDGSDSRHNKYYSQTLTLLRKYANAYIFTGHNHYTRHYQHSSTYKYIHEINHAGACGQFWNIKVCRDGTPAGYTVYSFDGNDIVENRYKAAGVTGFDDSRNAIRMYLGSDSYAPSTNANRMSSYTFGKSNTVVYANIFDGYKFNNEDDSPMNRAGWTVELFLNNTKVCDMTPVVRTDTTYGYHNKPSQCDTSSNYFSSFVYNTDYLRNDADWWWMGRALNKDTTIKNRNGNTWSGALTNSGYKGTTVHIYAGTLPSSVTTSATNVKIKATSPWGKVYECTSFTKFSANTGLAWTD